MHLGADCLWSDGSTVSSSSWWRVSPKGGMCMEGELTRMNYQRRKIKMQVDDLFLEIDATEIVKET